MTNNTYSLCREQCTQVLISSVLHSIELSLSINFVHIFEILSLTAASSVWRGAGSCQYWNTPQCLWYLWYTSHTHSTAPSTVTTHTCGIQQRRYDTSTSIRQKVEVHSSQVSFAYFVVSYWRLNWLTHTRTHTCTHFQPQVTFSNLPMPMHTQVKFIGEGQPFMLWISVIVC